MSRRTYVMRCSACDDVAHEVGARLYRCPECGSDTYGSLPADVAPPRAVDAHVPVMTDLWMDGVAATDGTDIGSRRKRKAYMAAHGLADANDFAGTWAKAAAERAAPPSAAERREIRETIGQTAYRLREARRGSSGRR